MNICNVATYRRRRVDGMRHGVSWRHRFLAAAACEDERGKYASEV